VYPCRHSKRGHRPIAQTIAHLKGSVKHDDVVKQPGQHRPSRLHLPLVDGRLQLAAQHIDVLKLGRMIFDTCELVKPDLNASLRPDHSRSSSMSSILLPRMF